MSKTGDEGGAGKELRVANRSVSEGEDTGKESSWERVVRMMGLKSGDGVGAGSTRESGEGDMEWSSACGTGGGSNGRGRCTTKWSDMDEAGGEGESEGVAG